MKCSDVQDGLAIYWDLPEDDEQRRAMDLHIATCEECAQHFNVWQESVSLIRTSAVHEPLQPPSGIVKSVMTRIYEVESWRKPIAEKMYTFTEPFRRNVLVSGMIMIMILLGGLVFGTMQLLSQDQELAHIDEEIIGVQPVGTALGEPAMAEFSDERLMTAVASIQDPMLIQVQSVSPMAQSLIVTGVYLFIVLLLGLNWFNRIRH